MLLPSQRIFSRLKSTVSAWRLHNYGGSSPELRCDEVPFPKINSPDEVLVKVAATSINPLDVMMVQGYGKNVIGGLRKYVSRVDENEPVTLGRDFSGSVVARGGNCLRGLKPGDEVWGATFPSMPGCHAEYVVLTKKPVGCDHVGAASIPYAALTAWSALSLTALTQKGWNTMIIGAAGGVGSLAAQILKSWDCEVTAICSTDAMELVGRLGVDTVVDYKSPEFKDDLAKMPKFDVILDCTDSQDNFKTYIPLLVKGPHASYVTLSSPVLSSTDSKGLLTGLACSAASLISKNREAPGAYRWGYFAPNQRALQSLADYVEEGRLTPVVNETLSFGDMEAAYARVGDGHARGKVVITID